MTTSSCIKILGTKDTKTFGVLFVAKTTVTSSPGSSHHCARRRARLSHKPAATTESDRSIDHLLEPECATCVCQSSQSKPMAQAHQHPSHCPASPSHSTRNQNNPRD